MEVLPILDPRKLLLPDNKLKTYKLLSRFVNSKRLFYFLSLHQKKTGKFYNHECLRRKLRITNFAFLNKRLTLILIFYFRNSICKSKRLQVLNLIKSNCKHGLSIQEYRRKVAGLLG